MNKHLVFIGAGHAHLTALARCKEYTDRGHRVTVINPSPYHYYSGMGPGMLSGIYRPQDIRFNIKKMVEERGAVFIRDAVVSLDANKRTIRLQGGAEVGYDAVSFNIGSGVPLDHLNGHRDNVFTVKPIGNLRKAKDRIAEAAINRAMEIAVVGGGAAGVEISGNVWRLMRDLRKESNITLIPGQRMLEGFPLKAGRLAKNSLEARRIRVLEGVRAAAIENRVIRLSDNRTLAFDICFIAVGVRPPALFQESGIVTGKSGGLLVNRYLQSVAHPEVFGGGDCIDFKDRALAKVGVYAVRQNPVLFYNLLASLENAVLREFLPQRHYMLILNLGNGTGILSRGKFVWNGKSAFFLKNYIDLKFMRTFQLSGEREEEI